jgi:hypothetical protein
MKDDVSGLLPGLSNKPSKALDLLVVICNWRLATASDLLETISHARDCRTLMTGPPYYILISQSDSSPSSQPQIPLSTSLSHPILQYHYLDDSPLALLPRAPDEQVLLLDYNPNAPPDFQPMVRSVSTGVAMSSIKVLEAPGASAELVGASVSEKMYILGTTTSPDDKSVTIVGLAF